jgi:hypothetical protein
LKVTLYGCSFTVDVVPGGERLTSHAGSVAPASTAFRLIDRIASGPAAWSSCARLTPSGYMPSSCCPAKEPSKPHMEGIRITPTVIARKMIPAA